nr:MAG TPA: hypothetical protein [Bacteriophage sp.]
MVYFQEDFINMLKQLIRIFLIVSIGVIIIV